MIFTVSLTCFLPKTPVFPQFVHVARCVYRFSKMADKHCQLGCFYYLSVTSIAPKST